MNPEEFGSIAAAPAVFAGEVGVGDEVHLQGDATRAFAGFAATALGVERESARPEPAHLRFGRAAKKSRMMSKAPM